MEALRQALSYLKDRYVEELARFDHFENKCARFITFVTIIIAIITAFAGMKSGVIFHPKTEIAWLVLVLFVLGVFFIVCAWGHALLALRIGEVSALPKRRNTAEYLVSVSEEKAAKHIYNCYVDTIENLEKEINEKSRSLELAYVELSCSAWCLGLTAALIIYMEIMK